jgi:hypothetical protein
MLTSSTIDCMGIFEAAIEIVFVWTRDVVLSILGRHAEEFVIGRLRTKRHRKAGRPRRKPRKRRQSAGPMPI